MAMSWKVGHVLPARINVIRISSERDFVISVHKETLKCYSWNNHLIHKSTYADIKS